MGNACFKGAGGKRNYEIGKGEQPVGGAELAGSANSGKKGLWDGSYKLPSMHGGEGVSAMCSAGQTTIITGGQDGCATRRAPSDPSRYMESRTCRVPFSTLSVGA